MSTIVSAPMKKKRFSNPEKQANYEYTYKKANIKRMIKYYQEREERLKDLQFQKDFLEQVLKRISDDEASSQAPLEEQYDEFF